MLFLKPSTPATHRYDSTVSAHVAESRRESQEFQARRTDFIAESNMRCCGVVHCRLCIHLCVQLGWQNFLHNRSFRFDLHYNHSGVPHLCFKTGKRPRHNGQNCKDRTDYRSPVSTHCRVAVIRSPFHGDLFRVWLSLERGQRQHNSRIPSHNRSRGYKCEIEIRELITASPAICMYVVCCMLRGVCTCVHVDLTLVLFLKPPTTHRDPSASGTFSCSVS